MYLLLLDETNTNASNENKFFIYGGVVFSEVSLPLLHEGVGKIRQDFKYPTNSTFKFETWSKPKHLSKVEFAKAKMQVMQLAIENGVFFIAYLVKHAIAKNKLKLNIQWASNEVISVFDSFLTQKKDKGICIFDRLPFKNNYGYLEELFQNGITTASSNKIARVPKNIMLYGASAVNASHLNAIADIILGSFRYCVNTSKVDSDAFKVMMPRVRDLFYYYEYKNQKFVLEHGLLVRPHISQFYDSGESEIIAKFALNN